MEVKKKLRKRFTGIGITLFLIVAASSRVQRKFLKTVGSEEYISRDVIRNSSGANQERYDLQLPSLDRRSNSTDEDQTRRRIPFPSLPSNESTKQPQLDIAGRNQTRHDAELFLNQSIAKERIQEHPTRINNTSDNSNTRSYNRTLTMIVVFRGELGNHLSVLSMARFMQRYIEKELPGIRTKMIGEHQSGRKWISPRQDLYRCFPNQRDIRFGGGIWDEEFTPMQSLQKQWLGKSGNAMLRDILTPDKIQYLKKLLDKQAAQDDPAVPPPESADSKYSMPYVTARGFFIDRNLESLETYHDIRSFFQFNTESCCRERPEPGETVFHFRNFITEIPKTGMLESHGMIELSPNETAEVLFADNNMTHGRPRKVAIISRFTGNAGNYAKALQANGWEARVLTGQKGIHDFCFALSAATLIGTASSTYVMWASVLGNATLNRWYRVAKNEPSFTNEKRNFAEMEGRQFWEERYGRKERFQKIMLKAQ